MEQTPVRDEAIIYEKLPAIPASVADLSRLASTHLPQLRALQVRSVQRRQQHPLQRAPSANSVYFLRQIKANPKTSRNTVTIHQKGIRRETSRPHAALHHSLSEVESQEKPIAKTCICSDRVRASDASALAHRHPPACPRQTKYSDIPMPM